MKWKKMGIVFQQKGLGGWRDNSALTPTPILLNSQTIRVYAGFRDKDGVSRIGYVDLDANDPTKVKSIAEQPVLDIGHPGCFDDNGVILGDLVKYKDKVLMYYVGFQLVKKVKFLAFSGLATSTDNGESFHRVMDCPIMDRAPNKNSIRAIHSVIWDDNIWKIWYAAGNEWQIINNTKYPKYNIWYTESADGVHFNNHSTLCINTEGDEYRIGRPSVFKKQEQYYMFYTKGGTSGKDYFPGLATSMDGKIWQRQDDKFGMNLSKNDFDSTHLCYPRLIKVKDKIYCIYNGNNMGVEGFGVAELIEW